MLLANVIDRHGASLAFEQNREELTTAAAEEAFCRWSESSFR